jgi:RNA-directed DNA polymerase
MQMQQRELEGAVSTVLETAKQEADAQDPRQWGWVEASVWTERMLAALSDGVKGGKWFSLMDKVYARRTLEAAWKRVADNRGAAGVDGVSVELFKAREGHYLEELEAALREGRYRPEPVRRVHIPKGSGQTRPLGIPTVKDRIVQTALKMVLEPIFERKFLPVSYGFRPGRGCKDALREVDALLRAGYTFVVDADVMSYFDTLPQGPLMDRLKDEISDSKVLALVEAFLGQDILDGLKRWRPTMGTPQGAVLSPLLANLYLHSLDVALTEAGHKVVRYADDFVILCRSQQEAEAALMRVQAWVVANGLALHPEKTHTGDCREPGHGFEFLGYRFECGRRSVRKKSLAALKDVIRHKTRRTRGDSLKRIIEDLNPILRGWFGYFKHALPWTFRLLDGFIRRRLRSLLRKQQKRPGFGRCHADHLRWPNAFFAEQGLFSVYEAFVLARQSR